MSAEPSITRDEQHGVIVIAPTGEFDLHTVDLMRSAFAEAITAEKNFVVVDLSGTEFLDSMSLGTIIGARRRATGWGGWLRLAAPQPAIRRVLEITELDRVLAIYASVDAAVAGDRDGELTR